MRRARRSGEPGGPFFLALVAFGLAWLGWTFHGQVDQIFTGATAHDFQDYYFSTKAFRQGASIYDLAATNALSRKVPEAGWSPPYVYPPYLTLLFIPISYMRYVPARVLWLVLNYGFLLGSIDAIRRLCALVGERRVDRRLTWLAAVYTPCVFAPVLDHMWCGQSNLLVLFLVSWGIYLEWRDHVARTTSGDASPFPLGALLLAVAGLTKLYPLFLFPCYFAMRRFKSAITIGVWCAVLTGLTLLVIPLSEFFRFPEVLDASMYVAKSQEQHFSDHSASSALRWLVAPAIVPAIVITLLRGVPYAVHFVVFGLTRPKLSELGVLLRFAQSFVLLACVMFRWWEHHLVMLVFPFFVGAYACARLGERRSLTTLCLAVSAAYVAIVGHPLLDPWLHWGAKQALAANHGIFAAQMLLLGVLEVLVRKSAPVHLAVAAGPQKG